MTPEQWHRVRELFEQALDRAPSDAAPWLAREAADDAVVRQEVMSLLDHHTRAGSFLGAAVAERMPDLLADDDALAPGTTLGAYTIIREIGRGGMGRVYLATDGRLGRTVALKALPPRLTRDASQRERLRREARAAAALTHPGICTVYALEELNDELFIATEYVDGHTLREEIASGRPPSAHEIRQTARELASALASAHANGTTHRDLKPENVMRTKDGRLKILDFGLARINALPSVPPLAGMVTQPGVLIGTPAYMAPEQLNGQPVDAHADVFAFGVVLYEYACGAHPFEAGTSLALLARVLESDARPIVSRCPGIPPSVAGVIDRCLRKSPSDRFPSAVEMVAALADPTTASLTSGRAASLWRTHQLTMMALYVLASTIAWRIKEFFGTPGSRWLFVALGIGSAIAGIIRAHLMFTQRMNTARIGDERRRTDRVTTIVDLLIAACLFGDGLLLGPLRPLFAVLTIALAIGIALARVLIEPATAAAAFHNGGS